MTWSSVCCKLAALSVLHEVTSLHEQGEPCIVLCKS